MSAPTDLRYDCERQGCFNKMHRCRFKVFADCFERGINFTDIDGCVECNNWQLWMEWKSPDAPLTEGQRKLFQAQVSGSKHNKVFVVWGDTESMQPESVRVIDNNGGERQRDCTFEELHQMVKDWFAKANDIQFLIQAKGVKS